MDNKIFFSNGTFSLNNSGSKWVTFENGKKIKIDFLTKSGKIINRTALYFINGDFGYTFCINYKGKKIMIKAFDKLED